MKKIIAGILVGVLLVGIPLAVGAQVDCSDNCCDYEVGSCCWRICCSQVTHNYTVSYFEKVGTGIFYQGREMVRGVWTSVVVEAHNAEEAASSLGLSAGYDCFVAKI